MNKINSRKSLELNKPVLFNFIILRKRRGLTQEEVAEALGVSTRTVMRWESHMGNPTLRDLKNIASLFKVSIAYIVGEQIELDHWWNYSLTTNNFKSVHGRVDVKQ